MSGPIRFDTEAEWLAWRHGKVGGSLIGAVLGVSPWTSPLGAYHQLVGLADDPPDNLAMRVGRLGQQVVAKCWAEEHLSWVDWVNDVHEGEAFDHPDQPRLTCTLDYRVEDGDLLEVKITGARDAWRDGPPSHVEAQARWQLGVVRANDIPATTCHVVCCTVPGWRIRHWPIDHDENVWQAMRAAAEAFLHNHVDPRRPPRATILDLDQLAATAGTNDTALIAVGDRAAQLEAAALDYFDRNARARETAKDADEAKAVLYQLMGDHTDAWVGDTDRKPLVTVRRQTRTSVTLKGLPPQVLEELADLGHLKTTEYPTLKVSP